MTTNDRRLTTKTKRRILILTLAVSLSLLAIVFQNCSLQSQSKVLSGQVTPLNEGGGVPVPTPTPTANPSQQSPTPTPTPGENEYILENNFLRAGTFLTCNPSNPNFGFNIPMTNGIPIRKIEMDLDFYHAGWEPGNVHGWHTVFWLHRGQLNHAQWDNGNVSYMNFRGPSPEGILLQSNINQPDGQGPTNFRGVTIPQNANYHLRYVLTIGASSAVGEYTLTRDGTVVKQAAINFPFGPVLIRDGGFFIHFGTQEAEGPEAITYDWTFSNLDLKFYR